MDKKWFKVENKEYEITTMIDISCISSIEHNYGTNDYTISYDGCEMILPQKEGEELMKMLGLV